MYHRLILGIFLGILISCEEADDEIFEDFTINKNEISIDGSVYKIDCSFKSDSIFYNKLVMASLLKSNPIIEITILDSINFGAISVLEKNLREIGVDSVYYKIKNNTFPRALKIEVKQFNYENYTDIYIHSSFFELRRDDFVIDYIRPNHLIPLISVFALEDCEPVSDLKLSITELSNNHTENFPSDILGLLLNRDVSARMGNLIFKSNYQCKNENLIYRQSNLKQYLDSSWFRGVRVHTDTLLLKLEKLIQKQ